MCCYQGKFSLPPLQNIPHALYNLFTLRDSVGSAFHQHILFYNNALAMTSVGKTTVPSVNQGGGGPYSYVLCRELIHNAGSILPLQDRPLTYSQLYIHDTDNALEHRLARHNQCNQRYPLNPTTLNLLQGILHEIHLAIPLYRQALEMTIAMPPDQQFTVSLHFDQNCDNRRYNLSDYHSK
jgi:hypothetical protein